MATLMEKGSAMESRVDVGNTDTEGEEARTVESVVERVVVVVDVGVGVATKSLVLLCKKN
ncbi:unnamed protein product [Boreogadus saida]